MSVYGRKRLAWKGETAEGIWIFREKGSWAAAEYASDCHRAVERYHWSDIIRRDHGCNQSLCSWFFYAINRLVRALSYLQKKGDFIMEYVPAMYATFWALIPPVVAIVLALITKEVYSSLFVGILVGGLFYSGFSFEGTIVHIFEDGIIGVLSDSYNVGILVFLIILGAIVCLMNKAGGSAAFGAGQVSTSRPERVHSLQPLHLAC